MITTSRTRFVNPRLGAYFGIFVSLLTGLVLLLMIFEQLGTSELVLRWVMLVGPLLLYCAIGLSVPSHEVVMVAVEIAPGAAEGLHTHPGEVMAYVQEGTLQLEIQGRPTATLKAGDVVSVEAGKVHQGTNTGKTPTKLLATFVVEKGKPLTMQVK